MYGLTHATCHIMVLSPVDHVNISTTVCHLLLLPHVTPCKRFPYFSKTSKLHNFLIQCLFDFVQALLEIS